MFRLINYIKQHRLSFLTAIVILIGMLYRITAFLQVGKDYETFLTTVNLLLEGNNPYYETIRSFNDPDLTSGGYAYLPGLMYVFYFLYVISFALHLPYELLWKLPNFLAEVGTAILLYRLIKDRGIVVTLLGIVAWLFNPYLVSEGRYTYTDAIPVFFMMYSLYKLGKDDVIAGASFGLAVVFKTFPVFAFPVFLLLSRDKVKFLLSGFIIGILASVPFMTSVNDFLTYLKGSLFVHESRGITGRPFLFYISYFYKIELFQIIPIKYYTYASIITAWSVPLIIGLIMKIRNPFVLSSIAFLCFYLFTPVFNRTYIIWALPVFIVALSALRRKSLFTGIIIFLYAFYYWYLKQWVDGFHITKPI